MKTKHPKNVLVSVFTLILTAATSFQSASASVFFSDHEVERAASYLLRDGPINPRGEDVFSAYMNLTMNQNEFGRAATIAMSRFGQGREIGSLTQQVSQVVQNNPLYILLTNDVEHLESQNFVLREAHLRISEHPSYRDINGADPAHAMFRKMDELLVETVPAYPFDHIERYLSQACSGVSDAFCDDLNSFSSPEKRAFFISQMATSTHGRILMNGRYTYEALQARKIVNRNLVQLVDEVENLDGWDFIVPGTKLQPAGGELPAAKRFLFWLGRGLLILPVLSNSNGVAYEE